jgi:hypothetical protein
MEERFLIFIDGTDDAAMFPVASLLGVTVSGEGAVVLNFVNGLGPNATEDKRDFVTLTCTADAELKVFKSIADAISGNSFKSNGYVVIADDVNSSYVDSDITACAISLNS